MHSLILCKDGTSSPLAQISSRYITDDEDSIEGYRSRHTIRITTSRAKCDLIVADIRQTIDNIKRDTIDLLCLVPPPIGKGSSQVKKWISATFDNATIEELGHITRASIQNTSKHRVRKSPSVIFYVC
jgi:hypothetical protein